VKPSLDETAQQNQGSAKPSLEEAAQQSPGRKPWEKPQEAKKPCKGGAANSLQRTWLKSLEINASVGRSAANLLFPGPELHNPGSSESVRGTGRLADLPDFADKFVGIFPDYAVQYFDGLRVERQHGAVAQRGGDLLQVAVVDRVNPDFLHD